MCLTEAAIHDSVAGFLQDHWATLPDWQELRESGVGDRINQQFQESRWALMLCTLDELIPYNGGFHAMITFSFEGGKSMTLRVVEILRHEKKVGIVTNPDAMEMNGGAISNSPNDRNLMFAVHQFAYAED